VVGGGGGSVVGGGGGSVVGGGGGSVVGGGGGRVVGGWVVVGRVVATVATVTGTVGGATVVVGGGGGVVVGSKVVVGGRVVVGGGMVVVRPTCRVVVEVETMLTPATIGSLSAPNPICWKISRRPASPSSSSESRLAARLISGSVGTVPHSIPADRGPQLYAGATHSGKTFPGV